MIWWVGYRRVLGADHVRWPLLRREAWEVLAPDRDPGFGGCPTPVLGGRAVPRVSLRGVVWQTRRSGSCG
jgi:hypothetical protein